TDDRSGPRLLFSSRGPRCTNPDRREEQRAPCSWCASALLGGAVQAALDGVAHQLVALVELELCEDVLDVVLDRLHADERALGDLAVGVALGHQAQHLGLARGEAGFGAWATAAHPAALTEHERGERGREHRLAAPA